MNQRVCIVLLTGLGDVVNGLPIANALRRSGFARHITWVAEPVPAKVLEQQPAIDDVVVFHKRDGVRGVRRLARELGQRDFDLAINLNVYIKSAWPTLLSRAPRRIGFGPDRAREGVWLFETEHVVPRKRAHTLDMFLEFLDHLGVPREPVEWRITFSPEEQDARESFFAPLRDRPVVALVPASANRKKDWPATRFAAVADALVHEHGAHVVLVGGPSARERKLAREIVEHAHVPIVDALGDDARKMMWLIAGSDLVIAPDTGPLHVARACEVPVIGLFGHTNPWRVGPYRKFQELWIDRYTDFGASPDPSSFDPKLGRMELITVDDVLQKIALALKSPLVRHGA